MADNPFDQFDTAASANPFDQFEGGTPTPVALGEVIAPDAHMTDDFRASIGLEPVEKSVRGDLSDMLLRGLSAIPELGGDLIALPANANEAIIRAMGGEPSDTGVFAGMRDTLRSFADVARGPAQEMDELGIGAGSIGTGSLVEALNPYANANRQEAAEAFTLGDGGAANYSELTLGDRAGTVGRFALEQAVRSGPEMAAAVASLPAYVLGRTNQIAETRAENDKRPDVSLADLLASAPAAAIEGTLERFTTGRLMPGAGGSVAPGVTAAVGRIAKELGIQAPLGGAEEVAAYLGETLGTEKGSTGTGAIEAFAGGAVGEGAIGGTVQGVKEAARAVRPNTIDPEMLRRAAETLGAVEPTAPPAVEPAAPEDDTDLAELLVRNLLDPAVAAELGLDPEPAPALGGPEPADPDAAFRRPAPESAPAAPPALEAPEVRTSQPAQILTPEQSGQVSAPQSAPAGAGADLGKLYQRGNGKNNSSAQALQLPDGTWQVRSRKAGRWQDWQPRDSFDPSPAFGYRETAMGGGAVNVPGVGRVPVAKADVEPRSEADYNPLLDMIAGAGGISRADAARFGVDPASLNDRRGIKPLYGKNGVPLDSLREMMIEEGYFPEEDPNAPPTIDLNDVWDMASRALAGEPVGPMNDERMLELQMQAQADRYGPEETPADRDPDEDLADWFDEVESEAGEPLNIGDEAEALSIVELAERAAAAGMADMGLAQFTSESNAAYAGRLWDATYQQEARRGPDREAEESGIRDGVRAGEGGQAGFSLQADTAPRAQEVAPPPSAGLFGAPSARDFIDDAQRSRDASRDGKTGAGRTDMLAGDGELFAGDRPAQASVDQPTSEALESVEDQTDSPAFKRWFGESQVVDGKGRPLAVYHGAPDARFMGADATFMSMKDRYGEQRGVGAFWFARDYSTARSYADDTRAFDYQNAEPAVIPAFLKLENPLVVDAAGKEWREAQAIGKTTDVIAKAQAEGHDGVIIRNVRDNYNNGPRTRTTDTYVVFDSRQIKSADRNSGAFDPADPSILANEEPGTDTPDAATAFESLQQGEADAEMLGLREAVNKALGERGDEVIYLHGTAGLPDRLRSGIERRLEQRGGRGRTAALYDQAEQQVYIFTDVVTSPDRAAWNALHEFAGHHALRTLLGDKLDHALNIAMQNPTVAKLADAIAKERKLRGDQRLLATEEALAELAAAVRTGDYAHIESRYNVPVPEGIRAKVARAVENFLRRLKALFDRNGQTFTDEDVRELLEAAWSAANGEVTLAEGVAGARESTVPNQTQTATFRRWFGDSAVVDANGEPLVVYHGAAEPVAEFRVGPAKRHGHGRQMPGIYFSPLRSTAAAYARTAVNARDASQDGPGHVVEAYLSIQNPAEFTAPDDFAKADRAALEAAGHDGAFRRNNAGEIVEIVVFTPSQIKSATANNGAFDPERDSILESVEYTDEQREFMRKAGLSGAVDTRTSLQRVVDWARGKKPDVDGDSLIQATLDQFHGLKRATQEAGITDAERNAYIAARQINTGSTMEAVLLYGAPRLDGGALRVNRDIPGLLQALGPVGKQMPQFLGWMVARRAQVLKQQGRENLMTEADIAAGLALAKGHEGAFNQAAKDYLRLKNAILDLGEQTGTIDPAARAMWDSIEYIPFYREKDSGAAGPGTRQGLANQSSGIRRLKGGETALSDPLANIIQNFTRLVDSAMKNRAVMLAVDGLAEPYFRKAALAMKPEVIPLDQVKKHLIATGTDPDTVDSLPDAALKGVAKMLAVKAPEGDDIVRVMRDGKAEYYHVDDPLLLRALTAFNEVPTHWGVKPFVWAKQMLTAGATATPEFLAANLLRDTGEAWATSQHRFIPLVDTLRGAVERVRESEMTQDLMMAGSAFHSGYFHTGQNDDTAKAIRRALRKHGVTDSAIKRHMATLYNPKRWWDLYRTGMEASEMGSRIMLAQRHMAAGGSFLESAHEAKDFLDFSMRGDDRFVQFFTNVLPFLNARLQGGYRLGRVGTTKGRRGKLAARMALIATASTSLYLWNMMVYGAAYEELEDWDKDAYWHIGPGTEWHTRIPKPFEIGLVAGTFVERMWAGLAYQLTDGKNGDRPKATIESFIRGIVHTMAIDPLPQLARPVFEVQSNHNRFFDSPIESLGDKFKAPEDRFSATTSDAMKAASSAMTDLVGDDNALSPKQLQHLWRGYTAGAGGYLLDSTDWVLRQLTDAPERPDLALRDFPLIGRFARGDNPPASTKYMDEFYKLRDKATQQSDRAKQAVIDKDPRKAARIDQEFGWMLGARETSKRAKGGFMHAGVRSLNRVADELSALRKADQAIYESRTMTGEEKREALDKNNAAKNAAVRKAVRRVNESERKWRESHR